MRKLRGGIVRALPAVLLGLLCGCSVTKKTEPVQSTEQRLQAALEKGQIAELESLIAECGFTCGSILDGDSNISGVREIDAFFAATLTLQGRAAELEASASVTLANMAGIVGADVEASAEDTAVNIVEKIANGFDGRVDGEVRLKFDPPRCEISATASVEAAAKCDVNIETGDVEVICKGECVADVKVQASCNGEATVRCRGTAPRFECTGLCQGFCDLNADASCEGTCRGNCEFQVAGECDGECVAGVDDDGMCTGECKVRTGGTCNGECRGACQLEVAATCDGQCRGECNWEPPEARCEGGARVSCQAEADASVMCRGECRGEVEPPQVDADCEATARVEAAFNAECTPPEIGLEYELTAQLEGPLNAEVRAAFEAELVAFVNEFAELETEQARLQGILDAAADLPEAGADAVRSVVSTFSARTNLEATFQLGCAIAELDDVAVVLGNALDDLQVTVQAAGSVSTAFRGTRG